MVGSQRGVESSHRGESIGSYRMKTLELFRVVHHRTLVLARLVAVDYFTLP